MTMEIANRFWQRWIWGLLVAILFTSPVIGQDAAAPAPLEGPVANNGGQAVAPKDIAAAETMTPDAIPEEAAAPMSPLYEMIGRLNEMNLAPILAVLGGLLLLIDYVFPTDWPAYVAYILFAVCVLLIFANPIYGLVTLVALLLLHQLFLRRFLENADGTVEPAAGA